MKEKLFLFLTCFVLYILIFPKINLFFLSFFFLIPFFIALKDVSFKKCLKFTFLFSFLSYNLLLYWIFPTLYNNEVNLVFAILGVVSLSFYLSLYWVIYTIFLKIFWQSCLKKFFYFLFPATLWVSLEFIRSHLFSGFPWFILGSVFYKLPILTQIASVTGVYGVSFLIVLVNTTLFEYINKAKNKYIYIFTGIFIFTSVGYGYFSLRKEVAPALNVVLIQPNIPQHIKWNIRYKNVILNKLFSLTKKASWNNKDLLVWPESVLPGYSVFEPTLISFIKRVSKQINIYQIIGSNYKKDFNYYNSAFFISPKGNLLSHYDKIHLVLFGETIPLRVILSRFVNVVNEIGEISKGTQLTLFSHPKGKIAVVICFEAIFAHLVRRFVKRGADYLVNITNDAWFGKTSAPYQHFSLSVFRSIENRISLIRVANTGITAVVDPWGRIKKQTSIFTDDVVDEKIIKRIGPTFYSKYGDIFSYLCIAYSVILLLLKVGKVCRSKGCLKSLK